MIRAAFFGTPPAAVPVLAALCEVAEVALVVTRADRPVGRSGRPHPPAVKEAAGDWGLPVAQPAKAGEVTGELSRLGVDVAVLAAYGQLIPPALLAAPAHGFVNVHFSVLPRWRGAAPVARAILAGDTRTGVTLMQMDAGLDTGPLLAVEEVDVGPAETAGELTARLASRGARLLADLLGPYVAGDVATEAQDESAVTVAPRLTVDEARLDPAAGAADLVRRVRAFHPRPGAWAVVDGDRFKVIRARRGPAAAVAPGRIEQMGEQVVLGAADGTVELVEVQPSGKPAMAAAAWMNGRRGEPARLD